jgi:preprotein translocase subunit YajC
LAPFYHPNNEAVVSHGLLIWAQAGAGGNATQTLVFLGVIFAIMYFVMIRPQQKQLKEHRNLLSALKKGDDVVTQGGMLGKIHAITDKLVTLEVANGVRIRVLKTSVQGKTAVGDESVPVPKSDEKREES